ncbi:MAG: DinB family protein [Candidatus Bipolaricaulota bacterium]|nr:DinB family protein [Candidatus Bipolaricaulota bacterium]MCS7274303.1 DinB family protein [Candidatus Bipolaricaulota bacterium]MDW8111446.1 DinB family protein [Candidatus Bipolaricaulota bacterium]
MDLRETEIKRIEKISELLLKAARAVPKEKEHWKPMPTGKSAHEILVHLGMANYFFAALLKGTPPAQRSDPKTYHEAITLFEQSKAELVQTIRSVDPARFDEKRTMPWGEERSIKDLITSPMPHMAYHWGQINYLQTLWGDQEDRF